jgi:hypothetical protein
MAKQHVSRDLLYFTHSIGGRKFAGWYRLLSGDCMEILSIGLIRTIPLDGRAPEEVACDALEEFVRTRQRLGEPVLSVPDELVDQQPDHSCPPSRREETAH